MSNQDIPTTIREQIAAIVASGQDVRQRVARLVNETIERSHLDRDGLAGVVRSVMDGAATTINRALPEQRDSVLRQVVDGLGDGFRTAAEATRLALMEAAGQGKRFAEDDLAKVVRDLRALSEAFVDAISHAAGRLRDVSAAQLQSLREHAGRTLAGVRPSLEAALAAAQQDPLKLGEEAARAGLTAARLGAGQLFTSVGQVLQRVGERLDDQQAGKSTPPR